MKFSAFLNRFPGLLPGVLLALVLSVLAVPALAQSATRVTPCSAATPNNALCIGWEAVTTATSGATISGVNYRVERKFGSGAFTTVQASGTSTQHYATNLSTGTYVFRVFANCTACTAESAASNEANGAATPIPVIPNAPVIIIAATIREGKPPVYRIIQSVNLRSNEVVIVAPASMRPLFAAR